MRIKKAAMMGTAVGAGIAVVVILLNQWNRYNISYLSSVSSLINRISFAICPTYLIIGFLSIVRNEAVWFLLTVLSNAVLYGEVFALVAAIVSFFRRGAA
jgi:K+-sensing histidine kinase KdpD